MGGSKMDVKTNVSTRQDDAGRDTRSTWRSSSGSCSCRSSSRASDSCFMVRIMAIVGLYVMLALGLNIVVGYAGLLDFGYIAFYAIGAYAGVHRRRRSSTKVAAGALRPFTYFLMIPVAAALAALRPASRSARRCCACAATTSPSSRSASARSSASSSPTTPSGSPTARRVCPRAGESSCPKPGGARVAVGTTCRTIHPGSRTQRVQLQFIDANLYWYYIIVLLVPAHDLRGAPARRLPPRPRRGSPCARTRSPHHRWASTS